MEGLTESPLLSRTDADGGALSWAAENVWNPFVNGTGVRQIYNNFVEEKLEPAYVPQAKTFSKDWVVHTLASASGAVVTYGVLGKAAGMGFSAVGAKLGAENALGRFLSSQATAQIVSAGLYDLAKSPNPGETRIGNALGSAAAFGVFAVGNSMLGQSATIAQSGLYSGLGRVAVGAAGGLTALETSHYISGQFVDNAQPLTWDHRISAMASGGFLNFAMPPLQKAMSNAIERFADGRQVLPDGKSQLAASNVGRRVAADTELMNKLEALAAEAGGDSKIKVMLLTQQFEEAARKGQVEMVAKELAQFVGGAKKSLHTAIYDFRLRNPEIEKIVIDAFNERAENGVDVKLAFFQPSQPKTGATAEKGAPSTFAGGVFGDEPMGPSPEFLARLSPKIKTQTFTVAEIENVASKGTNPVQPSGAINISTGRMVDGVIDIQNGNAGGLEIGTAGITGGGKLMHNKYIVRDAGTPDARVWTGSANFTEPAWGVQDNNILQIQSPALALVYDKNFHQMWESGKLQGTGQDLHTTVQVGGSKVSVAFSPGDGAFIDAEFARRISEASEKVHVASMVISSPKILQALSDKIDQGMPVEGVYDAPQMRNVANAWKRSGSEASMEKLALWNKVRRSLVPKNSHPYSPEGPHDYMHNKTIVIDGKVVLTGSFNLSQNATMNAENILAIENTKIAGQYSSYIDNLVKLYGRNSTPFFSRMPTYSNDSDLRQ